MEYNTVVLKKYNQLFDNNRVSLTSEGGVSFSLNAKGELVLNGTATANISKVVGATVKKDHIYFRRNIKSNAFAIYSYYDLEDESIVTALSDNPYMTLTIQIGTILNNYVAKCVCVDLTEIYGSGNEPTTVEQFLTDYPQFNEYVEYKENGYFEKKYNTLVGKISKNLFDISQIIGVGRTGDATSVSNEYGYVVENSIVSKYGLYGTSTICKGFYIELKRNTTYTLTLDVRLTQSSSLTSKQIFAGFRSFDNASSNVSSFNITNFGVFERHSIQFTPSNDYNGYLSIQAAGNAGAFTNLDCKFKDIQLELGSTATDYEPYGWIEKEYNSLSLRKSKNLFDSEDWYNKMRSLSSGSISKVTVDGKNYYRFRPGGLFSYQYMKGEFKSNTRYTLSCLGRRYFDEDVSTGFRFVYTDGSRSDQYINSNQETNFTIVSTANKTIDYISLLFQFNNFVLARNIQLEEGSTATEYEPYGWL